MKTSAFAGMFALLTLLAAGASSAPAAEAAKKESPAPPPASQSSPGWKTLFDGKTLTGWKEVDFSGRGAVVVTNNEIVLKTGYMTGIVYTNAKALPRANYEISLEARRVDGSDFFCGLTFPVNSNQCSFVVGGWGGSLVGLSSLNGEDAANNETARTMEFKQNQWYRIRVEVKPDHIRTWIDDEKMADVDISERTVSIRIEMDMCVPLGVATWSTTGGLRNIRIRNL